MKTKRVRLKPEILDIIRSHPDYSSPSIMIETDDRCYCTIKMHDCEMYYSRNFDIPYFDVNTNKRYTDFGDIGHFYKIVSPENLKGSSVAEKHIIEYRQYSIEIEDKLFEI